MGRVTEWLLAVALLLAPSVALGATAMTVLDDSDWRPSAAVLGAEGIEREMTPALLLKTEFKEPVFLFDPTDDETITHITDFRGKLYLSSCTRPLTTATGSVFTYDPEAHQWQKVFQVNDEGLVRLEVYGDRLYAPGPDANDGGWDYGNVYLHDGTSWVERRTVPRAIHEYGLAVYRDRIYVSADVLDPPPEGMPIDEAWEKGLIECWGRVLSSGDDGLTWREEYRSLRPAPGIGLLTTFGDRLVLDAYGDLIVFDGERWLPLGLNPNALIVFDWTPAGDTLLVSTTLGLCALRGERFRRFGYFPFGAPTRAAVQFGDVWVVLQDSVAGGRPVAATNASAYPDLREAPSRSRSVLRVFPASRLDDLLAERVPGRQFAEVVTYVRSRDMAVSAHAFRGRLYLGTHPEGRVLALPVVKEGTLDSAPHPVASAGTYMLSWEAATPAGTSCRLQVRTAAIRGDLEKQPFVGPDGTQASSFDTSGAVVRIAEPGFVQYRVLLRTEDPALTPYLKRVTLRAGR
jgi:hypothetical protein